LKVVKTFSRRNLLRIAAIGSVAPAGVRFLRAQQPPQPAVPLPLPVVTPAATRSVVSLVRGEDRRKLIYESLMAIDRELAPALKRKKYVLIKPNLTSNVKQLAATHADTLRGILDYVAPRFKGPVIVAEASSGNTMEGFDNFKYRQLISEYPSQRVDLIDLNREGKYVTSPLIDTNLQMFPVRLAARLMDPDAFILSASILKTHNTVVATMGVKNMVMGAPLHGLGATNESRNSTDKWHDKVKFHTGMEIPTLGAHLMNYNLLLTARKLAPFWGATVIDGLEGMEGDGPVSGTPVPSRIAIASLDYVAADRVGVEAMGIDPRWVGYLQYCEQVGIGNYDISKIEVRGEKIAAVARKYRLHSNTDRNLQWMAPLAFE
jgi:uncharacterized protein (DUF362 family)